MARNGSIIEGFAIHCGFLLVSEGMACFVEQCIIFTNFSDGATASGLLVALSFIIERMKLEQICDVCLAVRSIRQSRKHFVATEVIQYGM